MSEANWNNATNPQPMLEFLRASGNPSERKLRLFGVACSRRVWGLLDELGRAAVETAALYADGLACAEELRESRLACKSAGGSACWYAAASSPHVAARNAALSAQAVSPLAEPAIQAVLLRDIFGPLPIQPVQLAPSWLTPEVVARAMAIYDERSFDQMTELADLLEQAGCTNEDILSHCRGQGPHVRGCWALDLILNRS